MVPSFGTLNCHTLNNSSSMASNAGLTLSSSSINSTQGLSYSRASRSGPALKKRLPCKSAANSFQSTVCACA
jgi:hypothetical protein